jgi:flagellar basal-body rod protein FlgB
MADVGGISFGQTIDVLGEAARGARMENDNIANNIANVDTPNFRRSSVSFREALAESLGTPADPDVLPMATSDDRQFAIGDAAPPVPYSPQAEVDESTQMRVDKSNVDIDQEMGELSANSSYAQEMSSMMKAQYKRLREAITESPT